MRALIVEDGEQRSALAASRALSAAGWTIGIGSPKKGLASWSRTATHWHAIPSPAGDLDDFQDKVNDAIARVGYDVVFGTGDAEVLALSMRRDRVRTMVPYPSEEVVARALDKLHLARAAERAGLAVPRTVPATDEELAKVEGAVVVKARSHWNPAVARATGHLEATVARDAAEAAKRVREIEADGGEALLQDLIRGSLVAYVVVVDEEGRVVADMQQEADRTWPPGAAVSSRARTVAVDRELAAKVERLLREFRWFGLAELQFLAPDGGEPLLVDLNGRFYGSLALAVGAGVNMPALWAHLVTGFPTSIPSVAQQGTRYQWLEGDLRRAWVERRGTLRADVWDCLRYAAGARHSIWDRNDPKPALRHTARLVARGFKKLL